MLTATQEDYLEAIYRITRSERDVHTSELAMRLGCKLPTVTRTVQKLVDLGFVSHESRGTIDLTRGGRAIAEHLVHRHEDLVRFLSDVLGLSEQQAEEDACKLEHGMSALASQRLHEWLIHLDGLSPEVTAGALEFAGRSDNRVPDFDRLPESKTLGWRG
jgi:DtxR family Mn-dependent transcriptional regulator